MRVQLGHDPKDGTHPLRTRPAWPPRAAPSEGALCVEPVGSPPSGPGQLSLDSRQQRPFPVCPPGRTATAGGQQPTPRSGGPASEPRCPPRLCHMVPTRLLGGRPVPLHSPGVMPAGASTRRGAWGCLGASEPSGTAGHRHLCAGDCGPCLNSQRRACSQGWVGGSASLASPWSF